LQFVKQAANEDETGIIIYVKESAGANALPLLKKITTLSKICQKIFVQKCQN